ncbi:hypothetical protein [Mangrovimonas aestuarii]|uniref:hypothetical protein n=1 Tax=Mangrovimonas aestuarii TaxID=3018443 RepID=UPI0023788139|nr:hypothetical protein [Mangrovimonas aestuarii]
MNSVLVKMEDIKNTQQSLIEKIGVLEVELFSIQSKELDKELDKVMQRASDSFDIIKDALETFEIKRNKIENEA